MSRRENPAVADATALSALDDDVRLLRDIIDIFRQRNVDRLQTSDLIEGLSASDGHRWSGEFQRDANKLARPLRPLLIRSKTIRFKDRTAKGYERRWFEKALVRIAKNGSPGARLS
jgi:hypothetical protein